MPVKSYSICYYCHHLCPYKHTNSPIPCSHSGQLLLRSQRCSRGTSGTSWSPRMRSCVTSVTWRLWQMSMRVWSGLPPASRRFLPTCPKHLVSKSSCFRLQEFCDGHLTDQVREEYVCRCWSKIKLWCERFAKAFLSLPAHFIIMGQLIIDLNVVNVHNDSCVSLKIRLSVYYFLSWVIVSKILMHELILSMCNSFINNLIRYQEK